MFTSNYKKNISHPDAVSIAGRCPNNFYGREYKKLAPKYWFFQKYKLDGDEEFYKIQYQKEVLDKLNPVDVYNDLGDNAILLCYEAVGEFCHRRLVAQWLNKHLGIIIDEI